MRDGCRDLPRVQLFGLERPVGGDRWQQLPETAMRGVMECRIARQSASRVGPRASVTDTAASITTHKGTTSAGRLRVSTARSWAVQNGTTATT
jgi:hypothetical protein